MPVNAKGHGAVHEIIGGGDVVKHFPHLPRLVAAVAIRSYLLTIHCGGSAVEIIQTVKHIYLNAAVEIALIGFDKRLTGNLLEELDIS